MINKLLLFLIIFASTSIIIWHAYSSNSSTVASNDKVDHESTLTLKNLYNTTVPANINSKEKSKRLLFMTVSYTLEQFLSFQKVLDALRDICNAGWEVTILLQVANGISYDSMKYLELKEQAFCIRSNSYIPIVLEEFPKIGFGLNSKHRDFVLQNIDNFDYFSYAEEDMVLTYSHLQAYLHGENTLKKLLPTTWMRYFIGFFRYEDGIAPKDRVTWEYLPHHIHVVSLVRGSEPQFIVTNNLNQAIYVLPREVILDLEQRCDFLSKPGQNPFYRELRRAMNEDWKFMSVGVSIRNGVHHFNKSYSVGCGGSSQWITSRYPPLVASVPLTLMDQIHVVVHDPSCHEHCSEATSEVSALSPFNRNKFLTSAAQNAFRKDRLSFENWTHIISDQLRIRKLFPLSVDEIYNNVIFHQYNLNLIDRSKFESNAKWAWNT